MFERTKDRVTTNMVKDHIRTHQTLYSCIATAVSVTGFVMFLARSSNRSQVTVNVNFQDKEIK